ncbi:crossover junction endonuclease MUS81 isoform X2 [Diospyros lotus]|uniref:crossover junction endonuclease MUS81 isoform X2 n=1 Tax=Diospyros lotus TaxID=55363 RepID=UPI00225BE532|nr:crossover junction endonuclease MUS81 isoform X2 [Diospyros lotus]
METQRRALCPENEQLVEFMWKKRQELADRPKGISDNIDMTLQKAYSNICNSKTPIRTLKDFSHIKGVGKWILKLSQEFFETDSGASEHEDLTKKGKKTQGDKRYVPQKNSAAYALLITLYRGTLGGSDFMRKQEIIDAAEASGLSRAPIMAEKGKGKPGQFGSSPRDWYSGWNCMKTLITKGLVVKSSCPAKYMLTHEGQEVARECLLRSGLVDSTENWTNAVNLPTTATNNSLNLDFSHADMAKEVTLRSANCSLQKNLMDVPPESIDKRMGYSKDQILCAFAEVSETSQNKEISSPWLAVLCRLREEQVYGLPLASHKASREDFPVKSPSRDGEKDVIVTENSQVESDCRGALRANSALVTAQSSFALRACSSTDYRVHKQGSDGVEANINILAMPPLRFGESFEEAYDVILVLDDREQFATQGSRSRKIIENICNQFKIKIEVRRLPVGDGIWIARHKNHGCEYVLNFIVERKKVDDLRCSIRDNRYRDQKLRLLRCGLKKLIYVVEGDPNSSEAAESIKTACFTTEISEGFDVQRTSGLGDTLRRYGYLTQAITHYYRSKYCEDKQNSLQVCPSFDEFIRRCQDLDKMTVSDVFAIQLMQIPQVTEEVAITVLDLYPTLLSLARAYSLLDGDISAQEEMLKKQSNNVINAAASRNIFQLVWGS